MAEDEYRFIEEKIKPQRKRRILNVLRKLGITGVYAIVFGVVASLALFATNKILASGGNEQPQPTVMLPKPTATPSALPTSTPTPEQETMAPEEPTSIDDVNTIIQDYEEMYDVFAKFCDSYSDTIVTVAKITEGTDCFQNPIESRDSFSGLVLHISSEQLYILTLYDGLEENNKYQIVFRNGESAEATVLGTDVVTGLAVISAEVESLSQEVLDSVRSAEIGSSKSLQVGDLVVAIGNPMGSMYSIGYGLIGSEPSTRYLTDRKISLYCTNLQYVSNGGGVVMNTSGKVIGIITHRFDEDNVGIHTFMGITEIEELILQLMNHERRGTMGIVVSDITQAYLNELGVPNGVYVTDVASGSPAMQAGISVGDVLISVAGEDIDEVSEFTSVITSYKKEQEIKVTLYRTYVNKNHNRIVTVTLDEVR